MNLERHTYRPRELSSDQVREICETDQKEGPATIDLTLEFSRPFTEKLSGKKTTIRFGDFADLHYKFIGAEELEWSEDGKSFQKEYCQILELTEGSSLFFVHHLRAFTFPLESFSFAIDMDNGLVTLVHASVGEGDRPREVERTFHFGYIVKEGQKPPKELHGFTKEMVGMIIDWYYDYHDRFMVRHIYADPLYKCDHVFVNGIGVVCIGEVCDYVKIRPSTYIMTWVETNGQGSQGCALMDLNIMLDVGSFFGINDESHLTSYTFAGRGVKSDLV